MRFKLDPGRLEHRPCPLCAGDDYAELARIDRYWMGVRTVQCRLCGMITSDPSLPAAELDIFYRHHYRHVYCKVSEPSADYLDRNGVTRRAEYATAWLSEQLAASEPLAVLDVGCADGSFLRALSSKMPLSRITGVEPGGAFAQFASIHAGCRVVSDLSAVQDSYDLIIVNHVLEHVADPRGFLSAVVKRLTGTGALYVDVPDGAAYSTINDLHLAHLHHFTTSSLLKLAALVGLRPESAENHFPPNHPPSVRVIFRRMNEGAITVPPGPGSEEDSRAAQSLRAIASRTWFLHRLRSYGPFRFLRRVVGMAGPSNRSVKTTTQRSL